MPRAVLAYLPSPASPRPARSCPQPRRKHHNPFSRYPNVQPKPRLGVKNYAPQNAPGLTPKTHANPPGITPVAEEAVVGCSVAAERAGASSSRIGGLAGDIESHLGPGFTKIESPTGNSIFRSADGTKQIRFDLKDFHGDPNGPHINLETWTPRNLYPGDTRMQQIENLHIYPKGP
jgi:hypothetical protein